MKRQIILVPLIILAACAAVPPTRPVPPLPPKSRRFELACHGNRRPSDFFNRRLFDTLRPNAPRREVWLQCDRRRLRPAWICNRHERRDLDPDGVRGHELRARRRGRPQPGNAGGVASFRNAPPVQRKGLDRATARALNCRECSRMFAVTASIPNFRSNDQRAGGGDSRRSPILQVSVTPPRSGADRHWRDWTQAW